MQEIKNQTNLLLDKLLPVGDGQTNLEKAARYSTLNSGKRLRPILTYAAGLALGVDTPKLQAAALSIELIHCYSLIHDDLPAMDDDDLRRGLPTCHKAFDEATAILVADGLQSLAFEVLTDNTYNPNSPTIQIAMVKILAKAAGLNGMVLGQAYDLAYENKQLTLQQLEQMHLLKTGALFSACIDMPLQVCSDPMKIYAKNLQQYAYHLGLAFQIQDDILDVIGDTNVLGKTVGSDQKQDKATFTSILGLDGAKQHLQQNIQSAINAIAPLKDKAQILIELAEFFISREY